MPCSWASPRLRYGNDTKELRRQLNRKQTTSQTCTVMRKPSRVTSVRSSEVKSATMERLDVRRSGQPWRAANQVPKFGTRTLSCGGRIINFRLELIRKRLGT